MSETRLAPITKTVAVEEEIEAAFERFTAHVTSWWPKHTHSVGEDKVVDVVLEPWVGGRLFERWADGTTCDWGTVTAWEPPRRVAFTWHPGRESTEAQNVSVVFTPVHKGTTVELTHGDWEVHGESADEMRSGYDSGWEEVLRRYVQFS